MEVATQTSLTGLSVLWDINIDPTAGFFTADIKKVILSCCNYSDALGLEDIKNSIKNEEYTLIGQEEEVKDVIDIKMEEDNEIDFIDISDNIKIMVDINRIKNYKNCQAAQAIALTAIDSKILNEYCLSDPTAINRNENEKINYSQKGILNSILDFNECYKKINDKNLIISDKAHKNFKVEIYQKEFIPTSIKELSNLSPIMVKRPDEFNKSDSEIIEKVKSTKKSASDNIIPSFENQVYNKNNDCSSYTKLKDVSTKSLDTIIICPKGKYLETKKESRKIIKVYETKTVTKSMNKIKDVSTKSLDTEIICPKGKDLETKKKSKRTMKISGYETKTVTKSMKKMVFSSISSFSDNKVIGKPDYINGDAKLLVNDILDISDTDNQDDIDSSNIVNMRNSDMREKTNILKDKSFENLLINENIDCSKENISTNKKNAFKCSVCGNKDARNYELRGHTPFYCSNEKNHICTECQIKFMENTQFDSCLPTYDFENYLKCSLCCFKTLSENLLTKHLKTHKCNKNLKPFACEKCNFKCYQKCKLKVHKRLHSCKKMYCPECDYATTDEIYFNKHKKSHKAKNKFQCPNCKNSYYSPNSLKNHMVSVHADQLPYHCKDCGYPFSDRKKLIIHRLKEHKHEDRFFCPECSYQCNKKDLLKDHMDTHLYSNARTFACSKCDVLCSGLHNFEIHMMTHV